MCTSNIELILNILIRKQKFSEEKQVRKRKGENVKTLIVNLKPVYCYLLCQETYNSFYQSDPTAPPSWSLCGECGALRRVDIAETITASTLPLTHR